MQGKGTDVCADIAGADIQNTHIQVAFEQKLETSEIELREGIWRIRTWQLNVGMNQVPLALLVSRTAETRAPRGRVGVDEVIYLVVTRIFQVMTLLEFKLVSNLSVTLYNRRLSLVVILRADSKMSGVKIESSCWFRTLGQMKDDGFWKWRGI